MYLRKMIIPVMMMAAAFVVTSPASATPSDCDICSLPVEPGPCRGSCPRYYYNTDSGRCEPFIYGCCGGNANNFLTLAACEVACPAGSVARVPTVSGSGMLVMLLGISFVGTVVYRLRRGTVKV